MKNTLLILLVVCVNFNLSSATSCSTHFTCGNCAAYKDCYWCPSTTKCEDYYGEKFANLICPGKWVQHDSLCPNTRHNVAGDSSADSALFNLLRGASSNEASNETPIESLLGGDNTGSTETSSQELKDLLHKLLLLKLLRKIKAQGTDSLTAQETKMLSQLAAFRQQGKIATPTTTTTTTKAPQSMNNEINQLLSILAAGKQVKATNAPEVLPGVSNITQKQIKAPITKPTKAAIETVPTALPVLKGSNKSETVMTLLKKIDAQNAGVEYQERPVESLSGPDVKHPSKSSPPPTPANARAETTKSPAQSTDGGKTTMREPSHQNTYSGYNYCKLYEEIDLCNSDRNCTWCNTKDVCIRRSDTDYQGCVAAKDNLKDKEFGLDTCLVRKNCKQCVENEKCYWCDVSKSCHTYPFFGYVPASCGGDWYVKQCDVQLAVIIIVLPLIIILLAMVTFYFCLKYCYYRRKVLRVPLFERPGVFDYRKDKKVYYVNPEDESSDTEMAAEKIRKKYRLPVEREPLIDPNS